MSLSDRPVLASGAVTGEQADRQLPERTRQVLSEESGGNDGLGLVLVVLALAPVLGHGMSGAAGRALFEVAAACAVGLPAGYLVGRAVVALERRDDVEHAPELVITLLLAVGLVGVNRLLHSDGIFAVFVAGLAYNAAVGPGERHRQEELDEVFNRYLAVPVFLVIGAVLPLGEWVRMGWPVLAFAAAVLVARRLPVVLALRWLAGLRPRDAVFVGWFGPMGVSAVFYLALAADEGAGDPRLLALGTAAVAASTVVHGVTEIPGRRWYARAAAEP